MAQFGLVIGVLDFLLPVSGFLLGGAFLCVFGRAVLTCQDEEPPGAGLFLYPLPPAGYSPFAGGEPSARPLSMGQMGAFSAILFCWGVLSYCF